MLWFSSVNGSVSVVVLFCEWLSECCGSFPSAGRMVQLTQEVVAVVVVVVWLLLLLAA